jgi:hypothetical protein
VSKGFAFEKTSKDHHRTLNFLENRLLNLFQKRSGGQTFNGPIDTAKTARAQQLFLRPTQRPTAFEKVPWRCSRRREEAETHRKSPLPRPLPHVSGYFVIAVAARCSDLCALAPNFP